MKKGIVLAAILSGVGLFGYSIYRFYTKQIALLKDFKWDIIDLKVKEFSLTLIKGVVTFKFESVSDIEITVKKIYLEFSVNGQKVGYINEISDFVVPARGFNNIPLEFTLNPQYVLKDIVSIVTTTAQQKDAFINLNGTVDVKSGFVSATVPVNFDYSLKEMMATPQK